MSTSGSYDDPPHVRDDCREVWRSGYRAGMDAQQARVEALEREREKGLASCSWCDWSRTYDVGTESQAQARADMMAHVKTCANNPNRIDADPASLFMRAVARAEQAEAERDALTADLAQARAERDEYKTLAKVGTWHNDCRPNRHKAAEEIQKSQAVIDKLADTVSALTAERDALTARLARVEHLPDLWREEAMTHAVRPPGAKVTVAELNEAYLRVSDARRACADELREALASVSPPSTGVRS